MKTVCLLPVANDARIQRRLAALERCGVDVEVLAFERPRYPGKPVATAFQSLGVIHHGHYGSRLAAFARAASRVRRALADADVVYAFGLDLHAFAWIASRTLGRRPSLVYEVADIHPTLVGETLTARAMRAFERRLLADTRLLVVTSEAFITEFYRGVQKIARLPHVVIENKPDLRCVAGVPHTRTRRSGPITIGYFGMLRCRRSWQTLRQIAERGEGRFRVYVRGVPMGIPDFEQQAAATSGIEYGGPYVAPDDLPSMYERIDLSWSAHRMDDNNSLLWNRANRFYEACAFQTPIVAQVGTQDGAIVAREWLGPCVDLADVTAAATRLLDVTRQDIEAWQARVSALPRSIYTESGEHKRLAHHLLRLANVV